MRWRAFRLDVYQATAHIDSARLKLSHSITNRYRCHMCNKDCRYPDPLHKLSRTNSGCIQAPDPSATLGLLQYRLSPIRQCCATLGQVGVIARDRRRKSRGPMGRGDGGGMSLGILLTREITRQVNFGDSVMLYKYRGRKITSQLLYISLALPTINQTYNKQILCTCAKI